MLVSLNQAVEMAEKGNYAVAAFNSPSLDIARAVIEGAEEMDLPVILAHAEGHESVVSIDIIGPILVKLAKEAKVPVVVHLDHCTNKDLIEKAIEIGFTSVMIDASSMDFEDNKKITKEVVDYARPRGVNVEAELGTIGTLEDAIKESNVEIEVEDIYTNPDMAREFVEYTGIDVLAASFGTAHGLYISEPKLDFERLEKIREQANVPIVMHGGSGLADSDYIKAINNGVRKINYFSYLAKYGADAMRDYLNKEEKAFFIDATARAREAMREDVKRVMTIFSNK